MLSLLILMHELGHYVAARIFHTPIREFAIGMGPRLLSHRSKKTGTIYAMRVFPIGGFVQMVGEDEESEDENALCFKPVWQRMIITAAGAFMNLLVGAILMTVVVATLPNLGGTTVLRFTEENALSQQSGLQAGDEVLRVNGARVHIASELAYEIMRNGVEPLELTVLRDESEIELPNVQFPTIVSEGMEFGMTDFVVLAEEKTVGNVIKQSFYRSISTVKMIWQSLFDLITGRYGLEAVSGPVGVTTAVSEAASSGYQDFLYLVVVITMNLGIFNLLPLPALDGGRLMFQIVELIRRKPLPTEVEGYVHFVGIVLLMILMVVITFKDVMSLFV
ncbi:MAG: site-2 protease family protein [Clostridia bacterium]|nr:site-2 protease family protein [Clostridia bacterium]